MDLAGTLPPRLDPRTGTATRASSPSLLSSCTPTSSRADRLLGRTRCPQALWSTLYSQGKQTMVALIPTTSALLTYAAWAAHPPQAYLPAGWVARHRKVRLASSPRPSHVLERGRRGGRAADSASGPRRASSAPRPQRPWPSLRGRCSPWRASTGRSRRSRRTATLDVRPSSSPSRLVRATNPRS